LTPLVIICEALKNAGWGSSSISIHLFTKVREKGNGNIETLAWFRYIMTRKYEKKKKYMIK